MNESDLENSLRLLRPAEPSPELEGRIALALETRLATLPEPVARLATPAVAVLRRGPAGRAGWLRLLQSAGLALAGAAAGVAAMWYFQSPPERAQAVSFFEPAESVREAVSAEEETVYGEGNEPARLVHYTSIERHAWTNPATGAWVQVEVPREDVVALPVSYQ